MARPIIGITGELEAARWRNWIREAVVSPVSYTRAVERAGGTPVGTYTLTVTATYTSGSTTLTHSQNLTLTVQ